LPTIIVIAARTASAGPQIATCELNASSRKRVSAANPAPFGLRVAAMACRLDVPVAP
jgi:hypothetical protein